MCHSGGEREKNRANLFVEWEKESRIDNKKREHPTILVKRSEQGKQRIVNLSLLVAVCLYNVRLVEKAGVGQGGGVSVGGGNSIVLESKLIVELW